MQTQNSNRERIARACVYAICIAAIAAVGLSLHSFSVRAQQKSTEPPANTNVQTLAEATGFYCNLKAFTLVERVRHAQLSNKLREARLEIKELPDGFAFRLQTEAVSLEDLAEWISGERKCCPFFDFKVDLDRGGLLWLTLEGRQGVKEFIRDEFKITSDATAARYGSSLDPSGERKTLSAALDVWVTNTEKLLVPAADAMPEERYTFTPDGAGCKGEFKGTRTFAEQVKHLAAANYQLGAMSLGQNPPHGEQGESAPPSVQTKAEIMEYLKGSFAYLHQAAAAINANNATDPVEPPRKKVGGTRLGWLIDAVAHSQNHYGQMVEYLRMNGIVPPASR